MAQDGHGEKMFFVKSTYSHLCGGAPGHKNRRIWKAKIPLKIKIWMWLICKNAFLTKDNLAKIKWQGDKHCSFCSQEESIEHLMFDCSSAKYVLASPLMFLGSLVDLPISIRFGNGQNVTYKMGKKFHMVGLAAICWALWRSRNNIFFENK
jgi:hypothetical protein